MNTAAIERHRPQRREWRTWTRHDPTLAGLDYDKLRAELRHGTDDRKDQLLAALVRLAQRNPELLTVVVACLLPGLRSLIARHARGLEPSEASAIAVAGLCDSVADHRPDGDTSYVANRLLQVPKRRLQRAVKEHDTWLRHNRCVLDDAGNAAVAQAELPTVTYLQLAVDAAVLTPEDAWLIYVTRAAGHTLDWAARRLGTRYETAKKRRQRAEGRWAAWWAPEALQRSLPSFSVDSHKEEVT